MKNYCRGFHLWPGFICCVFGLLFFQTGIAQINNITFSNQSPNKLVVCGDVDTFYISASNITSTSLTNVSIVVELPPGIDYIAGSVTSSGVSEDNIAQPDSLVFSATDMPSAFSHQFYLLAQARCPVLFNSDSVFTNNITVYHNAGIDYTASIPYNIQSAALSITGMSNDSVAMGNTFTRLISITNGGTGHVADFLFLDVFNPATVSFSNFRLMPGGLPLAPVFQGDTALVNLGASHFNSIGDLDNLFEQNEVAQIAYDVTLLQCGSTTSQLYTGWGCDSMVCQSDNNVTDLTIINPSPNLSISHDYFENTCYGGPTPSVGMIYITNNGSGPAADLVIDISQSSGATFSNGSSWYSGFNTDTLLWKSSVNGVSTVSAVYTENCTQGCLPAGMKTRFKVQISRIEPGETDTLVFNQYSCCVNSCASHSMLATKYRHNYTDLCGTNSYSGPPTDLNYYWAAYDWVDGAFHTGPTDIVAGDTATFKIIQSNWRFAIPQGPGARFQLQVVIPTGLSFSGNPNDFKLLNHSGLVFSPLSFNFTGNTITADYPLGFQYGPEKAETCLKLIADCGGMPNGSFTATVQYFINSIPDTTCVCLSCVRNYNFDVTVHCPPAPCPAGGMVSLDFEIIRTNYGLADNPDDGLADSLLAIDPTLVRTTFLMCGDTMFTNMKGIVATSTTNPTWQYGYLNSYIIRGQYLEVLNQRIRIVDVSSGSVYNCALPPPTVQSSGTNRNFIYDYSVNVLSGCLPVGFQFETGDSAEVMVNYRSKRTGGYAETNGIVNSFYLSDVASGPVFACDSFSGGFTSLGYYYTVCCGPQFHTNSQCGTVQSSESYYLAIGNCCSNYGGGNYFKNEYRYWARPKELTVIPPQGYDFSSASINYYRSI